MKNSTLCPTEEAELFDKPEVGMKIFVDKDVRGGIQDSRLCMPMVHASVGNVTLQDFEMAWDNTPADGYRNDKQRFRVSFLGSILLKIIEIGEGEQAGFIKVDMGEEILGAQEVWVQVSDLTETGIWRVDRRNDDSSLEGDRLDEICDPRLDVILRRTDDVRRLMIRAMKLQGGKESVVEGGGG